jgi:MFS family permease
LVTAGSTVVFDAERQRLQRRTLLVLSASAVCARAAMTIAFVVVSILTRDILGSSTWAGIASAAITVGTALSSSALSSYMNRVGRRPGLVLGYVIAAVGGLVAAVGGQALLIVAYLIGLTLFGVGQGSTGLARYAAADLASDRDRGKAIGYVVFASTIGAVGGPALSGPAASFGRLFGFNEYIGSHLVSVLFFGMAGLLLFVGLRPDPLVASGKLNFDEPVNKAGFNVGLEAIRRQPVAVLALLGLVVSQAVMVMVMTMTPLHMEAHGKSVGLVGWVLSAHTAGMFAFAPLAGWFADRYGRFQALLVSAVVLIVSTIMTAFAHEAPSILMFPGLYLLGLGWSFGTVASSALLTEAVPGRDEVAAQGAADLIKSFASGAGALASGFIFTMAGFHILSMVGIAGSGLLLVAAYFRMRLSPASGLAAR